MVAAVDSLETALRLADQSAGVDANVQRQMQGLAALLFRHDWIVACHADPHLDPAAAGRLYTTITNTLARGEKADAATLLAGSLRPMGDPGPSGSDTVAEFHRVRLENPAKPGFRAAYEILSQHAPGVDPERGGILEECWVYAALVSEFKTQQEEERVAAGQSLRKFDESPEARALAGTGYREAFSAGQQDLQRMIQQTQDRLQAAYDALFTHRFRMKHGIDGAEDLLARLREVPLPHVAPNDFEIPPP